MSLIKGIDISAWQGTPDFEKVKAAGIEFVIIRAGYGKNNIDKQFVRNITECNRLEIPCGVYWFSYALTAEDAKKEAAYCLAAVKPYRLEYPIYFDLEYDTIAYAAKRGVTIGKALATAMAEAFLSEIEKGGYYAANYSNQDYMSRMFDMTVLGKHDLWYAWYNQTCNRTTGLWQYGSTGKVDGIAGNIDMNYSFKDYPTIIRSLGINGLMPAAETPSTTDTDWRLAGLDALVKAKIIENTDYWKGRLDEKVTVGEVLGLLGKTVNAT